MKPTFEKTVGVLVKAYLNDTLVHGNCYACAVGNIVAQSMGYKLEKDICSSVYWLDKDSKEEVPYPAFAYSDNGKQYPNGWAAVFCTDGRQTKDPDNYIGVAKDQIDSTGYTWMELAKIEKAFESADHRYTDENRMFNGLMAVVDVLAEIHGISLTTREQSKLLFQRVEG